MLLNYHQHGQEHQRTPILILHGLFASQRNFRSIATHLAEHRRVISVDLRNHGGSFHADTMSYEEMAGDIFALLDHLQIDTATLLGHSMGGKAAMACALEQAKRIKGLCVADIAPVKYSHDHDQFIRAMKYLAMDEITNRAEADRALADQIPEKSLRLFLLQNLVVKKNSPANNQTREQQENSTHWRLNLAAIEQEQASILSFPKYTTHFAHPTLFIRGENSDYVTSDHENLIRQYFPTSQLATITNASHWLHVEQPALFLQKITEFLDENGL